MLTQTAKKRLAVVELLASLTLITACGGGNIDTATDASAAATANDTATTRQDATPANDGTATVADTESRAHALAYTSGVPVGVKLSSVPAGYVQCADEWNNTMCNFSGSTTMVYGAASAFIAATVAGPFDCNKANGTFGDPVPGIAKACYVPSAPAATPTPIKLSSLPASYVLCADEWNSTTCTFDGSTTMVYGAASAYIAATVAGPFDCSKANASFGDPLFGVAKNCYVPSTLLSGTPGPAPAPAPAPAPVPVTLTAARFSISATDFPNPDRGFYGWAGSDFVTAYDAPSVQGNYTAGQRLVLANVKLDAYRGTDLPASFLTALNSRFGQLRAAGMKSTLWFSYDFSEGGNDAPAPRIKRHLEQLKPILAANADVIPYMRAGFIGAWGEWHSSKAGNSCGYNSGATPCATADANRLIVRDALIANVPATTQIGIRYPADLMKWYPSPTQQTRLGMHNDCHLSGGPSDTGTYQTTEQRTYAQQLSTHTAFGGENCSAEPRRLSCPDILTEGAQYHISWYNGLDWAGFITAWRNGGCLSKVSSSIGYRLQLDGTSHATRAARGGSASVDVDLRNVGWGRFFTARKVEVTLRHRSTGALIKGSAGDLRNLVPQGTASSRISVPVAIPAGAATGDYDVYLSVPDIFSTTAGDARFAVRFANADNAAIGQAWEAGAARFKIGTTLSVN